jgi:hypothetical protein
MRRKATIAAAAVLTALGVSAIVAQAKPASAAPYCPNGDICFFQNSNYGGAQINFPAVPVYNLQSFTCTECNNGGLGQDGTWNDQISSVINNTGIPYALWTDSDLGRGSYAGVPSWALAIGVEYNELYSLPVYDAVVAGYILSATEENDIPQLSGLGFNDVISSFQPLYNAT